VSSFRAHRKASLASMALVGRELLIVCRSRVLLSYTLTFNSSAIMYEPKAHFWIREQLLCDFHRMSANAFAFCYDSCNPRERGSDLCLKTQPVGYRKTWGSES